MTKIATLVMKTLNIPLMIGGMALSLCVYIVFISSAIFILLYIIHFSITQLTT